MGCMFIYTPNIHVYTVTVAKNTIFSGLYTVGLVGFDVNGSSGPNLARF